MEWPTEVQPSGFDWDAPLGTQKIVQKSLRAEGTLNPGWYKQVLGKAYF